MLFRQIPIERGGWNSGVEVYPLVVARRFTFHGWQKGAEERRSTVAPCRGGSNRTHTPSPPLHRCPWFVFTPWVCFTHRERITGRERERERQQRLLTVDSIAGGVLMEAEICDLDELTSGQRGEPQPSSSSIPRQVEPRRRRSSASRALF